ncbi:MAG: N-6 DNA methylase [Succiniclasticum sp.]|uniref:N-6 DNA methylase n=1 Tax=Succiniclasticum sp. TaxID=2775030 RepID=UPI002A91E413|nr:N-6 DNA methylase [Succiniclasticum sp.]MDY6290748.1 N-6 DNA methylase [Succiniclasticum sp.]
MRYEELEALKNVDVEQITRRVIQMLLESNCQRQFYYYYLAAAYWRKMIRDSSQFSNLLNDLIPNMRQLMSRDLSGRTFYEIIEKIANAFTGEELKAVILIADFSSHGRVSEISTVKGISQLALQFLNINENDIVLNQCSGINNFLIEAYLSTKAAGFYGVEIDTEAVCIARARCSVLNDVESMLCDCSKIKTIQGNVLSQEFSSLNANKVFSDGPFMLRFWERDVWNNRALRNQYVHAKRTITSDWIFASAAHINQKRPGRTVVLMSNNGLWNEADREIRKRFVEQGLIEAVIALPERILSYTNIASTMLVLSENNKTIKLVDATGIYTQGRRQNSLEESDIRKIVQACNDVSDTHYCKTVSEKELAAQEYILSPSRYITNPVHEKLRLNSNEFGTLTNSINRGAVISSQMLDTMISAEPTEFQYLMLKDITNGELCKNLPYLTNLENRYERYFVKPGNLIISKISPFKIAMADIAEDSKVLANGNLYFIDIDRTKANPYFIMLYLQSEEGISQLNSWATGVSMRSISIRDLQKIRIPKVTLEEQNRIEEEYKDLKDQLTVVTRQADIIKNKMGHLIEEVL